MAAQSFGEKDHALLYAKYRPSYPDAMFEEIYKYCISDKLFKASLDVVVDVGCGSGQSTRPFCRYFRHVIGTDVSEQQIQSCIAKTNDMNIDKTKTIEFKACPAEDLSFLPNESVDLVTAAQAFQWFNLDIFNSEVCRVLKPGGTFAAFGYGINVLDDSEANVLQNEFYWDLLGDYYCDSRPHVRNHLRSLQFPFEPTIRIENEAISIRREMPLSAYIGYVSSSSAWQLHHRQHPDRDELDELHGRLREIYRRRSNADDPIIPVFWPGFLIMCRKPDNP